MLNWPILKTIASSFLKPYFSAFSLNLTGGSIISSNDKTKLSHWDPIIFFCLVIPIIGFVLYLGATAIMKGFTAKEANRAVKEENNSEDKEDSPSENLSEELLKLNSLKESGVITQEEFIKAKNKLLND